MLQAKKLRMTLGRIAGAASGVRCAGRTAFEGRASACLAALLRAPLRSAVRTPCCRAAALAKAVSAFTLEVKAGRDTPDTASAGPQVWPGMNKPALPEEAEA